MTSNSISARAQLFPGGKFKENKIHKQFQICYYQISNSASPPTCTTVGKIIFSLKVEAQ